MAEARTRVLVVEDEPDICWALEHLLARHGCAPHTAFTCGEGLAQAERESFDIAFIDAKLPDRDGLDLARQIRESSPRTVLVIVSGYFYDDDIAIQTAISRGIIQGFVAKPLDHSEILEWVGRLPRM